MATTQRQDAPKVNGVNGIAHTDISRQISTDSQISRGSVSNPTCWQRWTSWRYKIAFLMQMSIMVQVLLKLNMPIAIVCMNGISEPRNISLVENTTPLSSNSSYVSDVANKTLTQSSKEFHWESSVVGLILASQGFLAYITPSLTDWFSRHFGTKLVMQVAMLGSGVVTLLMPLGARMSPYVLIVLRCIVGMAGGVVFPITSELFSWWAPENEKVNMISFAFLGVNIGNIMAGVTSGFLCSVPIDNGWPFIFYVNGAITVLWCICWQLFGTVRPEDHPFVSKREKLFIIRTRLGMDGHQGGSSPPYKEIAKSGPVWGFLMVMAAHYFTTMLVFTYLPLYLSTLFAMNVEEIGLFTSLGYVVRFCGVILWGRLSNLLSTRTKIGPTATRKTVQCSGFFLTAAALVALGFIEDVWPALCLLMAIMGFQSCTLTAGIVLPLDIAPRYASFLSGLFLTVGGIISVPGPMIASAMTSEGTLEQWRSLFLLVAAVFALGAFCFLFLAKAEMQPWAIPKGSTDKEERTRPLTPDLMTRRMTVLSAGPPVSPAPNPNRFNFTMTVTPFNSERPWFAQQQIPEGDEESAAETRRNGGTTLPQNTLIATAIRNSSANNKSDVINTSHVSAHGQAYSNPAFEATDVTSAGHSANMTSSQTNDVRDRSPPQELVNFANANSGSQATFDSINENVQKDKVSNAESNTTEAERPKRNSLESLRRGGRLKLNIGQSTRTGAQDKAEASSAHASDISHPTATDSGQDPSAVENTRL